MMTAIIHITLAGYLASTVGYWIALPVKRILVAKISTWILGCSFFFHSLTLIIPHLHGGQNPLISISGALSLFSWIISGAFILFQTRTKTRILGVILSPLILLVFFAASYQLTGDRLLPPHLQGPLVTIHVILSVAGEALFALVALAGILYLLQDHFIKKRRFHAMSRLLPPLEDLDRINRFGLLIGFPLLTGGLLAGSVWAQSVFDHLWLWDPKLIWAFAFWLGYAFILHQRMAIGWQGHRAALLSLVFCLVFLFSLAAIILIFPSHHMFSR
ncbi:MAG: cytochrome c biogenesis protein [Syntrophobacterales bacterium]|jgi:ABC-type transport system involved in cytochrome c biogenesis permease subunit|nr:cytochrome c biogenesis protein [Syntrophobacterales bacterium]